MRNETTMLPSPLMLCHTCFKEKQSPWNVGSTHSTQEMVLSVLLEDEPVEDPLQEETLGRWIEIL